MAKDGDERIDLKAIMEKLRKKTRQDEIDENNRDGHHDDAGASPFSFSSETLRKPVKFEPNDGPGS